MWCFGQRRGKTVSMRHWWLERITDSHPCQYPDTVRTESSFSFQLYLFEMNISDLTQRRGLFKGTKEFRWLEQQSKRLPTANWATFKCTCKSRQVYQSPCWYLWSVRHHLVFLLSATLNASPLMVCDGTAEWRVTDLGWCCPLPGHPTVPFDFV